MTKEIELTKGKVALVDDEDFETVRRHKWFAMPAGDLWYAARTSSLPVRKIILLHRFILDAPADALVDHKNQNGLDCRRNNMRLATKVQNGRNRDKPKNNKSGYKGVSWHKQKKKWRAYIIADSGYRHLGYFGTPEEAAITYDEAAKSLHGEFARTNF